MKQKAYFKLILVLFICISFILTSTYISPNEAKAYIDSSTDDGITISINTPDGELERGESAIVTLIIKNNERNDLSGDTFTFDMTYETTKKRNFPELEVTRSVYENGSSIFFKCNGGTGCNNGEWKFNFSMPSVGNIITRTMSFELDPDVDTNYLAFSYDASIYPQGQPDNYLQPYANAVTQINDSLPDSVTVSSNKIAAIDGLEPGTNASLRGSDGRIYTKVIRADQLGRDYSRREGWNGNNMSWTTDDFMSFTGETTFAMTSNLYFQAAKTSDNKIATRSKTRKYIFWDTQWEENGATAGEISMEAFNNRVYQAVRGLNSNDIYTRSSADGSTWTNWTANGRTPGNVSMKVFNGRLYQAVKGTTNSNNTIYTRNTIDGINWSEWTANGRTPVDIEMEVFKGRLYQSVKGNSSTDIYTRSTNDGVNWTPWVANGRTPGAIELASLGERLYQTVRGGDNKIYTRYTQNGIDWSEWEAFVTTNKDVTLSSDGTNMIQLYVVNGKPYFRIINKNSYTWSEGQLMTWDSI